jgi:hypothetical protein
MNMKNLRDMRETFKVKIEYEGQVLEKSKVRGLSGLESVFKNIRLKLR